MLSWDCVSCLQCFGMMSLFWHCKIASCMYSWIVLKVSPISRSELGSNQGKCTGLCMVILIYHHPLYAVLCHTSSKRPEADLVLPGFFGHHHHLHPLCNVWPLIGGVGGGSRRRQNERFLVNACHEYRSVWVGL